MNNQEIHTTPEDVQAEISSWGFRSRVAEALETQPAYISKVLSGDVISKPIATKIAKILNCELHIAFPHVAQYQPNYDAKAHRAKKRQAKTEQYRQALAS